MAGSPIAHRRGSVGGAPRWSPDGRQLAYYSEAAGSWDVYTVDVSTGASRTTDRNPGFDGQPAWQPITHGVPSCP